VEGELKQKIDGLNAQLKEKDALIEKKV